MILEKELTVTFVLVLGKSIHRLLQMRRKIYPQISQMTQIILREKRAKMRDELKIEFYSALPFFVTTHFSVKSVKSV
ncbi:TPA: hypothetical protein DCX15_02250 [bacterium]|nr:hypothetical protein [bacterium]